MSPLLTQFAPLVLGLLVGSVAWWLLSGVAPNASRAQKACSSCGSPVFEEWRLCPDCGSFIDPAAAPEDNAV